jgi:hypothetical protein
MKRITYNIPQKSQKMTLKDYFDNIEDTKKILINRISDETLSSTSVVYRWISGEIVPPPIKRRIISEIIGLPESELFPEKSESL